MTRADRICTYVPDMNNKKRHIAETRRTMGNHHKIWMRTRTPPDPRVRDSTKSHGSDSIHLTPFWVHPTYPSPAFSSYLLPATLHPQADTSEPEGPDTLVQQQEWYTSSNVVTLQRCTLARQGEPWVTDWRSYLYCNVYFIFICACTAFYCKLYSIFSDVIIQLNK